MYCDEQTIHALARCINLNRSKGPSNLTVLINKIVYFMAPEVRFYKWNLGFLVTKTTGGGQGQFYIHSSKWGERRHGNPSKNKIYQVKFLTFCRCLFIAPAKSLFAHVLNVVLSVNALHNGDYFWHNSHEAKKKKKRKINRHIVSVCLPYIWPPEGYIAF